MKVKNIMFSGFAAAILMGVGAANAVVTNDTYNLANKGYVDAKVDLVAGQKENAANKFTDATEDAWKDATNKDVQFPTINVAERIALDSIAGISADIEDLTDIRTAANNATEAIAKLNGNAETPGSVANTIAAALNEKNYLTAVPEEYVTDEELAAKNYTTMTAVEGKGYLTAVPAEYVTDEELTAKNYTTMQAVEGKGYVTAQGAKDAVATEGYAKTADVEATYETKANAAATYETKANAAAYAKTVDVEATYETKANAAATYETKANAAATYETKANAAAYAKTADVAATYATTADVNAELAKKLDSTALTANGTYMITKTDNGIEYTAVTVATAADAATE